MANRQGSIVINVETKLDGTEIKHAEMILEEMDGKDVNVGVTVDDSALDEVAAEIGELDGSSIDVGVSVGGSDAQLGMSNVADGIRAGTDALSGFGSALSDIQEAGMQTEQNLAFLSLNEAKLGGKSAVDTYQQISDIVAKMPGDDNTMRSVLSTAQALGNKLNTDEMTNASKTMADYMSASATMGKMAKESEQDIMKYLLDGNTAELERGSIVSSRVDKLKDAKTFTERQVAMQKVLNELGYGGISTQDTMLNKQAEWEGMLYNAKSTLSSMWLDAEKGGADLALKINEATGGLFGMGVAITTGLAEPTIGLVTSIGQVGTGFRAIKDVIPAISGAISGLGSGIMAALTSPIGLVVIAVLGLLVIIEQVGEALGWWKDPMDAINTVMGAIAEAASRVWDAFANSQFVQDILSWLMSGVQALMEWFGQLGAAISSALGGASGEFDIIGAAISTLGAIWASVSPYIMAGLSALGQGLQLFGQVVIWVIVNLVIPYLQTLWTVWSTVFGTIYSIASRVWSGISTVISTAMTIIKAVIDAVMPYWIRLQASWKNLQSTCSFVFNIIMTVVNRAGTAWENFKSTVMSALQPVIDKIHELQSAAGKVGDFIGSIVGGGSGGLFDYNPYAKQTVSFNDTPVASGNNYTFIMNGNVDSESRLEQLKEDMNTIINGELQTANMEVLPNDQ